MRVIIAGGRDFDNYDLLRGKCDSILSKAEDITIISGGAKGADLLGEQYATERGYEVEVYPADWKAHGNSAGPIRNMKMLNRADAVIAFWDGASRGTEHMIKITKEDNKKLRIINYEV